MADTGERFNFGRNWRRFLDGLTPDKIDRATASLRELLGVKGLNGASFLDVGCGSGLFSLAAYRSGARVRSFDFDPGCVACAEYLRHQFSDDDPGWKIEQGSILDRMFTESLGTYDFVYSWGVLHHTGNMAGAFEAIAPLVAPGGLLSIAIYNDQGAKSRYWHAVKRWYNHGPLFAWAVLAVHAPLIARWYFLRWRAGTLKPERGMAVWTDILDWFGGYPFEVAAPHEVKGFFEARGFSLVRMNDVRGGSGCNEFVFQRGG